jgi:uncharacterized protein (TIGR02246 family)
MRIRPLRPFCRLAAGCVLTAAMTVTFASPAAFAGSGHASDEAVLRAAAAEYAQSFAAAAVDKLAGLWADAAILIDQSGHVFRGKEEIKNQYAAFFARYGAQPLEISVESIDFPGNDTAIETGISRLKNSSSPLATARYLALHVKRDGKWLMESVTESPYAAATNGEYLKPLSWLAGNWKAEGTAGAVKVCIDWANKNVMSINVEATAKDAAKSSHSEFIYWNPQTKRINSFQFDAEGGTSKKCWEEAGDNWIVHASSIQADGSESKADYLIKKIDSDSFTWQSKRRSLSGVDLPDTGELKITRVKS